MSVILNVCATSVFWPVQAPRLRLLPTKLEPRAYTAMVRRRPEAMMAERVAPIPTLRTGACRHLVVHRFRW